MMSARDWLKRLCPERSATPRPEETPAVRQDSPLPHWHDSLPSWKRAALSRTHSSTCEHADQWLPAPLASAGMTLSGSGPRLRLLREGGDPATSSTLVPPIRLHPPNATRRAVSPGFPPPDRACRRMRRKRTRVSEQELSAPPARPKSNPQNPQPPAGTRPRA